jgi:hypothetical protein
MQIKYIVLVPVALAAAQGPLDSIFSQATSVLGDATSIAGGIISTVR